MTIPTFLAASCAALALAGCGRQPLAQAASESEQQAPQSSEHTKGPREVATLAGGCFWCMEAMFQQLRGVEKVESGFSGGHVKNPTYEQVCTGATGHAESLQITFDPKVITYDDLLRIFFTVHDPTTKDRQGPDEGTQYRSAIFYHSPEQKKVAERVIQEVNKEHIWHDPIVTEVSAFTAFYPAEAYHRDYFKRNPDQAYCRLVIAPKVVKFREKYLSRLKAGA